MSGLGKGAHGSVFLSDHEFSALIAVQMKWFIIWSWLMFPCDYKPSQLCAASHQEKLNGLEFDMKRPLTDTL